MRVSGVVMDKPDIQVDLHSAIVVLERHAEAISAAALCKHLRLRDTHGSHLREQLKLLLNARPMTAEVAQVRRQNASLPPHWVVLGASEAK